MRDDRVFISFLISIVGGIAPQSTAFWQEYRGTWQQQMAAYARCLAAVQRAGSRCEQDGRGLPAQNASNSAVSARRH